MANQRTDATNGNVKVTLLVSPIGFNRNQLAVVTGLGLRRIRHSVSLKDSPEVRGMIHKVRHLVSVESSSSGPAENWSSRGAGSSSAPASSETLSNTSGGDTMVRDAPVSAMPDSAMPDSDTPKGYTPPESGTAEGDTSTAVATNDAD